MTIASSAAPAYSLTHGVPAHLQSWQLPPGWTWGGEGLRGDVRHYQEVVDALGRSLALVTAPDEAHAGWLEAEARQLAHHNHPSVPTTYHYWASYRESRRGPGYLRRWIAGETVAARLRRIGVEDVPYVLQVLRAAGSALAYLHDGGAAHGAVSSETVWVGPTGRMWLLGWEWAVPPHDIPEGQCPAARWCPMPPETRVRGWGATPEGDQWQLAALCFEALTGERPPADDVPPIALLRPECPHGVADVLDRALRVDPADRHSSVASLLRTLDRGTTVRAVTMNEELSATSAAESDEARLRYATGDDYDVLAALGRGTFGSVWRVRDMSLEREVALKMLHPDVATSASAITRFRREARLAAQLAHPGIVPIYDWDARHGVSWYTMELAEGGSVAELVVQSGPRPLVEIAPQVETVLDALAAAHATGIIHRDLKPENILLDRYRRWRVADFGIANAPGEERAGMSGTPAFAAPEQLLGEEQGAPADCFGVAAIVAYTMTGRPPFGASGAAAILARELAGDADLDGLPVPIVAWLRRGLAPDPADRFADAGEMLLGWRRAAGLVLDRRRRGRWWRRIIWRLRGNR